MKKSRSIGRKAMGLLALALPSLLLAQQAAPTARPTSQQLEARMRAAERELADIGRYLAAQPASVGDPRGDVGGRLSIATSPTGALQIRCTCSVTQPPPPSGGPPRPGQLSPPGDLDLGMQALAAMRQNDAAGRSTSFVPIAAGGIGGAAFAGKAMAGKALAGDPAVRSPAH